MGRIRVDGTWHDVKDGQNLLHACLSLGYDIPYFCWHPAMHSVGACRQCAVKQFRDEDDTKGRIVMSCMTPAADGVIISIDDPDVRDFRARVIEWLMVSHPHDCPVCDEGGECHLQDMTVMTGHDYRRYRFKKRTFRNQGLGPFVNHEMNRCIACYRCVRFYRDYAGGHDLHAMGAHHYVYFGRHEDGVFENEFSGNLVEVCPTGVFTDKTFKNHYSRKWDLQTAPSVCVHCGVGCNTIPGERYGTLRRIRNRYHGEVNGYFLCDRGRYGYDFVNIPGRVALPSIRRERGSAPQPSRGDEALNLLGTLLTGIPRWIGIGSPRASLESNYALRTLVGPERFCNGMSEPESRRVSLMIKILQDGPARTLSLREVEQSDAVLLLGEDVTNTAPRLALALRQSARRAPMGRIRSLGIPEWNDMGIREALQGENGPFYIAAPFGTSLDDIATRTFQAAPDDLARLGFAVARELSSDAPAVPELDGEMRAFAMSIAESLREAHRPLVIAGSAGGSEEVIRAAAQVAWALCGIGRPAGLCFAFPECNSLGAGLLGGVSMADALGAVKDGSADTVIILENDLYRREESPAVDAFLSAAKHVIVIDHMFHKTAEKADVLLPAATFAEADGTLVSGEGRAQRFYRVLAPSGEVRESWRWLCDLLERLERPEARMGSNVDGICAVAAEDLPVFRRLPEVAPPADFRIVGQQVPREPHRYSGRTAMTADVSVHEPKPPEDPDSPLSFSMEGYPGIPPASLVPRFWAPSWNSVQSVTKFQEEVAGPLRGGDPGIRLIEPSLEEKASWFLEVPMAFSPREDAFLVVLVHHIHGSEELSALSPSVLERVAEPYLALRPEDAEALKIEARETAEISLAGNVYRAPVKLLSSLPRGVAGLPAGLGGWRGTVLPAWGKVARERRP